MDRTQGGGLNTKFGGAETDQIWNKQLLGLKGDAWRTVRAGFTPIFTSGKMKMMMKFMNATSDELAESFSNAADTSTDLELKTVCSCFSMETIASCAFGVKAESFKPSANSKFVQ